MVREGQGVERKGDMGVRSGDTCILFRSLCRSFHIRLESIHFVDGDCDPHFPWVLIWVGSEGEGDRARFSYEFI